MASKIRTFLYDKASAGRSWYYRRLGMQIGRGCKISGSAKLDKTNPGGVVIGDHTVVSFRTAILTHDFINGRHVTTRIGSNCFVGACSVIMPGVTIGDHAIVGSGSVVYTDVPAHSVVTGNPARIVETGIVTGRWGIRNPKFLALEGISVEQRLPERSPPQAAEAPAIADADPDAALRSYFPSTPLDEPFDDSEFDSFALITLRAEIEETEGIQISDEDWDAITRPSDLRRFLSRPKQGDSAPASTGATKSRLVEINLPQMSQKGLSESWLFKEMGDIHWSIITDGLGVKSTAIADQDGKRLSAAFTRVRYRSAVPLGKFAENDQLAFNAEMTRFGSGMFFSAITAEAASGKASFELMSSFSKFAEEGNNRTLQEGAPVIPPAFNIPSAAEMPAFAQEYGKIRAQAAQPPIFTTEYEIVPLHDINGVGLLYFAAYPAISDICTQRFIAKGACLSPIARDICYFANSGSEDTLRFTLAEWSEKDGQATALAYLYRSDETRMATVRTTYSLV